MKTEKTALTRFRTTTRKVNRIFSLKKITVKDIEGFNKFERDYLAETATKTLHQLKGEERDDFLNKIEQIIPPSIKNDVWEYNHILITHAVSKLIREYGCMPQKYAIAEETGLSRQTVAKHFEAYKTRPEYQAEMEQFKFMAPKILAVVFKLAINGDIKAARLYLEATGTINSKQPNTVVKKQNNYIQINNTIITQVA